MNDNVHTKLAEQLVFQKMIDKELQEDPIYEKVRSISERLKQEQDHSSHMKKSRLLLWIGVTAVTFLFIL